MCLLNYKKERYYFLIPSGKYFSSATFPCDWQYPHFLSIISCTAYNWRRGGDNLTQERGKWFALFPKSPVFTETNKSVCQDIRIFFRCFWGNLPCRRTVASFLWITTKFSRPFRKTSWWLVKDLVLYDLCLKRGLHLSTEAPFSVWTINAEVLREEDWKSVTAPWCNFCLEPLQRDLGLPPSPLSSWMIILSPVHLLSSSGPFHLSF